MQARKRVYIIGSMTGEGIDLAAETEKACQVAAELFRQGYRVFIPHEHARSMRKYGWTEEQYMRNDLHLLRAFECVYCLPGWERKAGGRTEVATAMRDGKTFVGPVTRGVAERTLRDMYAERPVVLD